MVEWSRLPYEDGVKVQILVGGANVEVAKSLRAQVETRVGTVLGRFGDRIGGVVVRFSAADGPADGVGQTRCEIQVSLRPRSVRVEGTDRDLLGLVEHLSTRASRTVARALEREQELDPTLVRSTPVRRLER